jgi:protein-S-isoprenylcysteine O-methyltransferase Ste14
MIAWINLGVLALSAVLVLYYYVKSVQPAALEQRIGPEAYDRCARCRLISSVFMGVATVNYILVVVFPPPLPIAQTFNWPYPVSALIAVLILLPSGWIMWRGMRDAGEETMRPCKEHTLYGGIYNHIRHPQGVGEVFLWWVIAFLLHSPLLVIISFVWLPVWYWMVMAEEKDLLLRYGDSYAAYRARTGAFFPRLGRNHQPPTGQEG